MVNPSGRRGRVPGVLDGGVRLSRGWVWLLVMIGRVGCPLAMMRHRVAPPYAGQPPRRRVGAAWTARPLVLGQWAIGSARSTPLVIPGATCCPGPSNQLGRNADEPVGIVILGPTWVGLRGAEGE